MDAMSVLENSYYIINKNLREKIQNLISGQKKVMAWMESLGTGI